MNVHVYVNGEYLFTIQSDVPHENVKNGGDKRDYIGFRGSEELVSLYQAVEKRLVASDYGIKVNNNDELRSSSLNDINISQYLAKKFPNIERLELRADDNSITSKVSNTMGKQYGYPLVWLNCNKYNFSDSIDSRKLKEHQWERCLFQPKDNLDKIGSLIKYFEDQKKKNEQALYQGGIATTIDCIRNSATDNLLLKDRRVSSSVTYEVSQIKDFKSDQGFAFYENPSRATYITTDFMSSLKNVVQKSLFDEHAIQDDDFEVIGGSKTIKILSPVILANQSYQHVAMQAITLRMHDGKVNCDVTIYEGLLSDPFREQETDYVNQTKQQITDFLKKQNLPIGTISTNVHNLKLQLPLQTHCGRFVMTWMAAEVAGVDITKLSNYSDPFNQIFGKIEKYGNKIFPSGDKRVHPKDALSSFRGQLEDFFQVRREEYSKQYLSSGKQEIALTKELIALLTQLENGNKLDNLQLVEERIMYLSDKRLIKIINEGMANLGYGSLQTFVTQAKNKVFKLSSRDLISKQYQELEKSRVEKTSVDDFDFEDEDEDEDEKQLAEDSTDDDLFEITDISEEKLAINEQYAKINPHAEENIKSKFTELREKKDTVTPPAITIKM